MFARPLRLLLMAALLVSSGAHLALLQGAAWAGMLVARARSCPIAEAASTTFDGKHPCAMCLKIRQTGARSTLAVRLRSSRAVLILPSASPRLLAAAPSPRRFEASALPRSWTLLPDLPPPRSFPA